MNGELDIGGVFIPWLLVIAVSAFVASALIKRVLRQMNAYRFVWNSGLFDVALLILAVWGVALVTSPAVP